jgi:hypothetical protein
MTDQFCPSDEARAQRHRRSCRRCFPPLDQRVGREAEAVSQPRSAVSATAPVPAGAVEPLRQRVEDRLQVALAGEPGGDQWCPGVLEALGVQSGGV